MPLSLSIKRSMKMRSYLTANSQFYLPLLKSKLNLLFYFSTNTEIEVSETIIQNKHDMWFVSAHSSDKELSDIDSSEVCL